MKVMDFLFYYLACWFQKRTRIFKKMNPFERTGYVMGIASILWIMCFVRIIEYYSLKNFKSIIPNYVFVVVALFFMWLFKYIYIIKGRYKRILETHEQGFGVSEKTGITISIIFIFMSLLIPMALAVLLHKMDGSL